MENYNFILSCWNKYCKKEYKLNDFKPDEMGVRCTCGSFIITPSGKVLMQLIKPE